MPGACRARHAGFSLFQRVTGVVPPWQERAQCGVGGRLTSTVPVSAKGVRIAFTGSVAGFRAASEIRSSIPLDGMSVLSQ